MAIKLSMLTVSWISSLIDNTVLHFSSITLIEKVISLSENPFISSTTAKMLLMNFTSQTPPLLNPMSILVWFLAVNIMTPAQILPKKPCSDLMSTKTLTRFLLLQQGTTPNKILLRSILSPSNLASSNLAPSNLTSSSHLSNSQILNCASSH